MLIDSLVGVLLTDGGEWVEEEEGTGGGEEGTGVSVELMGGEEQVKYSELRTSVLASKRDTLYRSFQPPWLAVASSVGADLDSRPPMTVQYAVIMRTRLRQSLLEEIVTEAVHIRCGGPEGGVCSRDHLHD